MTPPDELENRPLDESALRRTLLEYEAILENASVGILFTRDRRVLHCNPKLSEDFGWAHGELPGQPGAVFWLSDEDYAEVGRIATPVLGSGQVWDVERRMRRKDGSTFLCHLVAKAIDPRNTAEGTIWIMEDVTERRAADEALKRLLLEQHAILQNASVGILFTRERRVLHANPKFEQMMGWGSGETADQPASVFHPSAERYGAFGKLAGPTLGAGDLLDVEREFMRRDRSTFWARVLAKAVVPGDSGHGTIWILEDITDRRRAERALVEAEAKFRSLVEHSLAGVYIVQDFRLRYVNPRYAQIFGYSPEEMTGMPVLDTVVPEDRELVTENISGRLEEGTADTHITRGGLRKDGSRIVVEVLGSRIEFEGRPAVMGTLIDITERRRVEEELILAARVFASNAEGIMITDRVPRILKVNRAFTEITGYSEEEVIGKNPRFLQSGRQEKAFYRDLWAALARDGRWQGEIWNRRKDGELYPEWLSISVVTSEAGLVTNYIGISSDISQRKRAERVIEHLSQYDALTQLPNRALFHDRLEQALAAAARSGHLAAVLTLDLDRFKTINETLGHPVGDVLLENVAVRLQRQVRNADTVARLGGDEFGVVLAEIPHPETAAMVAGKILAGLLEPIRIKGEEFVLPGSLGISIYPDDGQDGLTLSKSSEIAMYHAKAEGRNNYQFFTQEMNAIAFERMVLERGVRRALERGELRVHYQPQVDLASRRIVALEALVRWEHPERGIIEPMKFIPLAEETGLILPIGEWVLRTACREAKRWQKRGQRGPRVAVNLSVAQFRQQNLVDVVKSILEESGLPTECLELEITESMLAQRPETAAFTLEQLKAMGVKLSVDDFGTGYSSLNYLKRFPLDTLKIDRSFVKDISTDPNDAAITEAVIALAHSLGYKVVAEGVETAEQLDFLKRHDCDAGQGVYFCKPLPAEDLAGLLGGPAPDSGKDTPAKRRASAKHAKPKSWK